MKHFGAWVAGSALGILLTLQAGQASAQTRAEFGARLGYGVPIGKLNADPGKYVKDLMVGQIPIGLDLGARIAGHVFVGGYLSYGFGILSQDLGDACDAADAQASAAGLDHSCHGQDLRLGLQGLFHLAKPGTSVDPWFGVGVGYEWLSFTESLSNGFDSASVSVETSGFELLNLQAGVDFPVSPEAAFGPFVAFTFSQYSSASVSCTGDCGTVAGISEDVKSQALHDWLLFGVRGTLVF